jgi:glycosyltransferase involved in cell wall biosynthesis
MTSQSHAIPIDDDLNVEWSDAEDSLSRPTVLHLVDPGSSGGGGCTLRLVADLIRTLDTVEHRVMLIGTAKHLELARRCGLPVTGWMSPVRTLPFAGQRALQRYLNVAKRRGVSIDILHSWSPRTAALAGLTGSKLHIAAHAISPIATVATLHVPPMRGFGARFFRRVLARHPMSILTSSSAVARECRRSGIAAESIALFPSAVDGAAAVVASRSQVRESWKELGVDDQTFVVGLLSEPIAWPDARAAATSVARVALSGRPVRLALHHRALRRIEADRFLNHLKLAGLLVLDDRIAEPWHIVRGLDAALIPGVRENRPAPSVLPALWAMAAGVPVIVECNDSSGQLIDHDVSGLVIDPHDVNAASLQIVRLLDDRALGRRIGEAAQARIGEIHDIASYAVRVRHTYDLLLAGPPALVQA